MKTKIIVEQKKPHLSDWLSDNDIKFVRMKLREYPESKINIFLDLVWRNLSTFPHLQGAPNRNDATEAMREAVTSFKETMRHLEKYGMRDAPLPQRTFDDTRGTQAARLLDDTWFTLLDIQEAAPPLLKLISRFELLLKECDRQKRRRGEKERADKYGLVLEIAREFKTHLGPVSQAKTHSLFEIVSIVLRTAGLPYKDPSCAIKRAVDSLR